MFPVRELTSTHLPTNYNKPINQPGNPSAKGVGVGLPTERTTELPTAQARSKQPRAANGVRGRHTSLPSISAFN